jgi:hypothetical protein
VKPPSRLARHGLGPIRLLPIGVGVLNGSVFCHSGLMRKNAEPMTTIESPSGAAPENTPTRVGVSGIRHERSLRLVWAGFFFSVFAAALAMAVAYALPRRANAALNAVVMHLDDVQAELRLLHTGIDGLQKEVLALQRTNEQHRSAAQPADAPETILALTRAVEQLRADMAKSLGELRSEIQRMQSRSGPEPTRESRPRRR